jgi:sugar phosphate permease
LTDRFGPRVLIRTGVIFFGVGFMLLSRINSPVTFFLTFFMMAIGSSLMGSLPIGVALVSWFRRRRAMALGISATGMSTGGLLTQLVVLVMTTVGWRWTAFLSGIVVLLVGIPLAQLVRRSPEPYGLAPDGDPPDHAAAPGAATATTRAFGVDFTVREAIRERSFWFISLGHGSALLVVSAVTVHLVVHVTERLGYSLHQAATAVALLTAMQMVGHLSGGFAGDRLSKRMICAGCLIGHAAAILLLAFATSFWMVAVFAIVHGLSWGMRGPLMSAIRADYFGSASFGTIAGFSSMIVMFGMIIGPILAGVLADRTGSYALGFGVLAACAAVGSIFFVLARRPEPPQRYRLALASDA